MMLKTEEYRQILNDYESSDEQVKYIYEMECQIADAIFDQWLEKRNKKILALK